VAQGESDWAHETPARLAKSRSCGLILDGTVVRVGLDRKALPSRCLSFSASREDGQKVLLAIKSMGRREQRGPGAPFFDDLN